jgi:murein DD-endopeptidase MepM/ murein hydrolase activator NlpD
MGENKRLTIVVLPKKGGKSRRVRISRRQLRFGVVLAGVLGAVLLAGAVSWVLLALRAAEVGELRAELATLREEQAQVAELAATLTELEARYEQLRSLFGEDTGISAGPDWLPPAAGRGGNRAVVEGEEALPRAWPLAERGFITQPLLEDVQGGHPGLDIAVPTGSYILASGPGRVVEAAEDVTYGLYLLVDHGAGYQTLYAHASELLMEPGDFVQTAEVIGLTGSTGRSTSPHLHFEILLDGQPVDPLSMVDPP